MSRDYFRPIALLMFCLLLINPVLLFLITKNFFFVLLSEAVMLLTFAFVIYKVPRLQVYYFNFVFLIGIFIQAEAVFSFVFADYNIRDIYSVERHYYFNKPLLRERFVDKEFIVDYVTNAQGYRIGSEDDPETTVEKVDWLFLGDSYTQGAQVSNEQLYTSLLYRDFPNKIILNAGISGFGIADEYHFFKQKGYKLKPKKVFLQICNFNDFMKVEERTSNLTDYFMNYSNFYRYLVYPIKFANPAQLPLGRWTEPFYPGQQANADYNIFYKQQSKQKRQDLKNFEEFLDKLSKDVIKAGGELIVLQIPTKEQLYYHYLAEVVSNFKLDIRQLDMHLPNKFLNDLCNSKKIKYLDLFEAFSTVESEVFYQYDEHLNAAGHMAMSSAIGKFMKSDRSSIQYLSKHNAGDRYPSFSSDGQSMCFQSVRDQNMELFISDVDMTNESRLTFNQVDELHPSFLEGDSKIIFTEGDQDIGDTKLSILDIGGGTRSYLDKDYYGAIPSIGKQNTLAYARWNKANDGRMTNPVIVSSDLASGKTRMITNDEYESWRPVQFGDSLVYISKRGRIFNLYMYSLKTQKESQLTNGIHEIWDPNFSPHGEKLVFSMNVDDNWDLFILDLRTRKSTRMTKTPGDEWDPVFSPDGRYIYFAGVFGLRNGIYRLPISQK
ncbi:DPP IV N-terminal domain-containing protein [Dyadobacter crusticola]|uniref:DPP IV N-terminal domain-containing protein n=1 Tax=Dyadobacter crusticola TaxID=292407 RepID=UPI000A013339|nr:DPP IV N-terminal domain-containing protein [Dyadobacter crusticola]